MSVVAGIAVFALVAAFGLFIGAAGFFVPLGVILGLWGFVTVRRLNAFGPGAGDPSHSTIAPRIVERDVPSIDLGDELADLLKSAGQRAGRQLEDHGRLDPFVMYEDQQGNVRVRKVEVASPSLALVGAREVARSIDPSAPRVVLAVADRALLTGRLRPVVTFEAAERRFRDRTLSFVQPYEPRRLVFPARLLGLPIYLGDAAHSLRFSAAAGEGQEPS